MRSALVVPRPSSWVAAFQAEPERAAEHRRAARALAEHEQRGGRLAGEARETHARLPRERRRAVEDDEGEGAAAQQHVGAPRRARRLARTDHPEALALAEVRPVARVERARGIHVGDPAPIGGDALDHPAHQRRLPAPARPHDLGEPAARQPASRQRRVERLEARRQPGSDRARRVEEIGELLLEKRERHGWGREEGRGKRVR